MRISLIGSGYVIKILPTKDVVEVQNKQIKQREQTKPGGTRASSRGRRAKTNKNSFFFGPSPKSRPSAHSRAILNIMSLDIVLSREDRIYKPGVCASQRLKYSVFV
jgi:hypothetical protein